MSDVRARLLEVALELFGAQGFAKTTVAQLADRVGISKGAFYLHFRSKTALMTGLMEDLQDSLLEDVTAIARDEGRPPLRRFRDQIHFQFVDVREKRSLVESYLNEAGLELDEELTLLAQKGRVDWQRLQEEFLRLAFPEHDPRFTTDLAVFVTGTLNEFSTYVILEDAEVDPDRLADLVTAWTAAAVERLAAGDLEPVLVAEQLLDRETLEKRLQAAARRRVDDALAELEDLADELGPEAAEEVRDTVAALRDCLAEDEPRRAILQGLLANLREWRELAGPRKTLAHELRLKLV